MLESPEAIALCQLFVICMWVETGGGEGESVWERVFGKECLGVSVAGPYVILCRVFFFAVGVYSSRCVAYSCVADSYTASAIHTQLLRYMG